MRSSDKRKNINETNKLFEQRYLKSKGVITEDEEKDFDWIKDTEPHVMDKLSSKLKHNGPMTIDDVISFLEKEDPNTDTTTMPDEITEAPYTFPRPRRKQTLNTPTLEELHQMVLKNTKDIEDIKTELKKDFFDKL